MKLIIELDRKDYEELNTFYILNLGTEEYRKIIEKHCLDAIRYGTPYNPTGDAISRSALKEAVKDYKGKAISTTFVLDIIDNAPTVEAFAKEDMAGAYNEGYACGSRENTRPNEQIAWEQGYEAGLAQGKQDRPQGEWKTVEGYDGDEYYECSNCGEPWFLSAGTPKDNNMNFCPNCGADMRGKEE